MGCTLRFGDVGEDVRNLQGILNCHLVCKGLWPLATDGVFGAKTADAAVKAQSLAKLTVDGLVGQKTVAALLNVGSIVGYVGLGSDGSTDGAQVCQLFNAAQCRSTIKPPPPAYSLVTAGSGDAAPPAATPPVIVIPPNSPPPSLQPQPIQFTSLLVQSGNQFAINPWAPSPFVLGLQVNLLFQLSGWQPFQVSPGFQYFQNGVRSPNGSWTGQGFVQIGPPNPIPEGSIGPFDLLSPFVQAFWQKNDGQWSQVGFAVGNQFTWKIIGDTLALFVNGQLVLAMDTQTGASQPLSGQVFTGLQLDVVRAIKGDW